MYATFARRMGVPPPLLSELIWDWCSDAYMA